MIELSNVTLAYGERQILNIPSLTLPQGRVTAVIGRNGSGKSTLLRALVGLLPYEGSIRLDGDELRDLAHRTRARRVAYLPQLLSVPAMNVQTLVGHGRFARLGPLQSLGRADHDAIERAMELTDSWDLRHKLVKDLSGGERQRAYLAMVIAQDTPMLLLDEPGAHLDVGHRIEASRIMRQLAADGRGVVVTSHDLPEAFAACDDVCVVNRETIAAARSVDSVVADKALLRDAMGVSVRKTEGEDLLFPYALAR